MAHFHEQEKFLNLHTCFLQMIKDDFQMTFDLITLSNPGTHLLVMTVTKHHHWPPNTVHEGGNVSS